MKKKVLFLCTYNSVRSQIAEGLMNTFLGTYYEAYSAGVIPSEVNTYAIEVMEEIGIDISHHRSKSVEEFRNTIFDIVVTVCNKAKNDCPFFPGKEIMHHTFDDPIEVKGNSTDILSAFRQVRDEIKTWILQTFSNTNKNQNVGITEDYSKINVDKI